MSFKSKTVLLAINIAMCVLIALFTGLWLYGWGILIKVACYAVAAVGFVFGLTVFALKKDALFKSCFLLVACALVIVTVFALLTKFAHLNDYPTDADRIENLTEAIKRTGKWGMIVYVFIQILQVVILPLPAAVCYIPGSLIWGGWLSTLLASAGVIIGSVIAYLIGRFFGKRAVIWIAGKETAEKYTRIIGNKGKIIFLMMQILPFFPDDILCMIAGLASMNFVFFLAVMILVRPLVISVYCFMGSGNIIPFSGWGIPVWIAIFAVCIIIAVLYFRYQSAIEKWLLGKFSKNKHNKDNKNE